ncbi:MAG: hypothetical protein WDO18_08945 [Acidobacteriota bacterium]
MERFCPFRRNLDVREIAGRLSKKDGFALVRLDQGDGAFGAKNRDWGAWKAGSGSDIGDSERTGRQLGPDPEAFTIVKQSGLLDGLDAREIQLRVPADEKIVVGFELIELKIREGAETGELTGDDFAEVHCVRRR